MFRLNLLPTDRKRAWALAQRLQQWRGAMIIVVLVCIFANAGMYLFDRVQADATSVSVTDLATWQALNAKRESGQVTRTTQQLNTTIIGLKSLFAPLSTHLGSVSFFLAALPDDIQLTNCIIKSDGSFTLTGIAATRASFLALRTALDDTKLVNHLATSSTASLREKLPFEYTGSLVFTP